MTQLPPHDPSDYPYIKGASAAIDGAYDSRPPHPRAPPSMSAAPFQGPTRVTPAGRSRSEESNSHLEELVAIRGACQHLSRTFSTVPWRGFPPLESPGTTRSSRRSGNAPRTAESRSGAASLGL